MATIDGRAGRCTWKRRSARSKQGEADLILIGLDAPNAVPMFDVYAQLAYALKGSDVETVVIGRPCGHREQEGPERDEAAVIAKAREYKRQN